MEPTKILRVGPIVCYLYGPVDDARVGAELKILQHRVEQLR